MPSTDALQPPLTSGEKEIVKSYGGWTPFMQSFALKPSEKEDVQEAKQILEVFLEDDEK
ncbi:hypothetical protein FE257_011973 [Aspergillus nanangensis]|uniref:Uncharacterized protein n=1 Tax=Aspergillus nanangensis TaxID=2582783 RepID=A0AAD4CH42_ASPNN|nr:hypothetical protein FE257_011973 [Aspergillus nanangensis]